MPSVFRSVKIYLINLDSSPDRLALIAAQMRALDVAFERFPAITAHDGFACFGDYDENEFVLNTGRTASPEEAGCYASHLHLWKRCVELDEPILILEDDASFKPTFPAALRETARLIDAHGFIRLETLGAKEKTQPILQVDGLTLSYCMKYPYGTTAYAIAPQTASLFVSKSRLLQAPVDCFIKRFWSHGQPLFAIQPHSVTGNALRASTTIDDRPRPGRDLPMRYRRGLRKLENSIERARFNRAFLSGQNDAREPYCTPTRVTMRSGSNDP